MQELSLFLKNKGNLINLLLLLIVILGIPLGVDLLKRQQIISSRATQPAIAVLAGKCVTERGGVKVLTCADVPLKLFSHIGVPRGTVDPLPDNSPTATPSGSTPTPPSGGGLVIRSTDPAQFENQLKTIRDAGGGVLYIPEGTYELSKGFTIYSNTTLMGDGPGETVLKTGPLFDDSKIISTSGSISNKNIVIRDLQLVGPGTSGRKDDCCYGIRFRNVSDSFIINIEASNFSQDGIYLGYVGDKGVMNVRVSGCKLHDNGRNGISLTHGQFNTIDNCTIQNNSLRELVSAIDLEPDDGLNVSNNRIINNRIINNLGNGIGLGPFPGATAIVAFNAVCFNYTEGNAYAGIHGYKGNIFVNNQLAGDDGFEEADCSGDCRKGPVSACQIDSTQDLPPAPAKPTAFNYSPGSILKPVFAEEDDEGGSESDSEGGLDDDNEVDDDDTIDSENGEERACEADGLRCSIDSQCCSGFCSAAKRCTKGGSPSPSASASFSPGPSVTPGSTDDPTKEITTTFKVALSEQALGNVPSNPYVTDPTVFNYILENTEPGLKQIWVEFTGSKGTKIKDHINIKLLEEDPVIQSLGCRYDISEKDVVFTIKGKRFGSQDKGSVKVNNASLEVLTWDKEAVSAIMRNPGIGDSATFQVNLTRDDEAAISENCTIGVTQLSMGAKPFCREEGRFDSTGVKITIIDDEGKRVEETAIIAKNGLVGGLKSKLEIGREYRVYIKAPAGLRRSGQFTASEGTAVVTSASGAGLLLPVGDIFPRSGGDGVINSADKAELNRQWGTIESTTKDSTADFNRDSKINSFDWACMRYDFGQRDEEVKEK